jgi:hypothetical protein
MNRLPTVTLAPAPGETGAVRAARRRFLALAFLGAALIGAAAGLIETKVLP